MGCEWQSCGRCTPQEELFSPADADVVAARISMCRNRTWHKPDTRFALAHSMNMHGRAAAMVTPIGDKKRLFPAESAVSSSGCAGQGRVKRAARERANGSTQGCRERSHTKVCASRPRLQRARCDFVDFLRGCPRDLGANGDGAPPQAHIHLNLEVYRPGSPLTKFGVYVTVCNRRFPL